MHRTLLSVIVLLFIAGSAQADPHERIAVLEFELNDLTLDPRNTAELERTASIGPMLEKALTEANYTMMPVDPSAQGDADKGVGYLFDHADAAATLGRSVNANWVIVGRVHKASFLFVYFKVHVVKVATAEQIADLIVEVKGPQNALTAQGVQSLAKQIAAVIEGSSR